MCWCLHVCQSLHVFRGREKQTCTCMKSCTHYKDLSETSNRLIQKRNGLPADGGWSFFSHCGGKSCCYVCYHECGAQPLWWEELLLCVLSWVWRWWEELLLCVLSWVWRWWVTFSWRWFSTKTTESEPMWIVSLWSWLCQICYFLYF